MSSLSILPPLIVLLLHVTWLPPVAAQEAESLMDRARTLYGEGEYRRAEITLRGLLERQPGSPQALLWLSRALDRLERYDEAERAVKEALRADGASPENLIQLARVYLLKDKNKEARKVLDEAEKLAPDNADVYYYRGRTYGKIRLSFFRPGTAERESRIRDASYRRAIELNPMHPDAFFQLGYDIEEVRNDPVAAIDWYFKQASVNPGHDEAVKRLAICAIKVKDYLQGYLLLQQVAEPMAKIEVFADADGRPRGLRDLGQGVDVLGGNRLFKPQEIQRFEFLGHFHPRGGVIPAMQVDGKIKRRSDALADRVRFIHQGLEFIGRHRPVPRIQLVWVIRVVEIELDRCETLFPHLRGTFVVVGVGTVHV